MFFRDYRHAGSGRCGPEPSSDGARWPDVRHDAARRRTAGAHAYGRRHAARRGSPLRTAAFARSSQRMCPLVIGHLVTWWYFILRLRLTLRIVCIKQICIECCTFCDNCAVRCTNEFIYNWTWSTSWNVSSSRVSLFC